MHSGAMMLGYALHGSSSTAAPVKFAPNTAMRMKKGHLHYGIDTHFAAQPQSPHAAVQEAMRAQVDGLTTALRNSSWCLQLRKDQRWVPGSHEAVPAFVSQVATAPVSHRHH